MNPRTRYELLDYDYLHKLSAAELQWLNDFSEEYIHANFDHDGEHTHTTPELIKDCYDRNNSRNRCVWTIAKASGLAGDMEGIDVAEVKSDTKKKRIYRRFSKKKLTVKKFHNKRQKSGQKLLDEDCNGSKKRRNLKTSANSVLKDK